MENKFKLNLKLELIDNYRLENALTIKKFCEISKIKYYNYRQVVRQDINVSVEVLFKVAKTIGIYIHELFN